MCLHVGGKRHLVRESIKALEAKLDPNKFVRLLRSAIVNIDHVREIHRDGRTDGWVFLSTGERVRLNRGGLAEIDCHEHCLIVSLPTSRTSGASVTGARANRIRGEVLLFLRKQGLSQVPHDYEYVPTEASGPVIRACRAGRRPIGPQAQRDSHSLSPFLRACPPSGHQLTLS